MASSSMEAEILEIQKELKRVRNERILLELRSELAREKQLLSEAQQRLDATTLIQLSTGFPPHNVSHPTVPDIQEDQKVSETSVRGIKRSHSVANRVRHQIFQGHSNASEGSKKNTPERSVQIEYDGRYRNSYNSWMCSLRSHFTQYPDRFSSDAEKITEAKRRLSDYILSRWTAHSESIGGTQTWDAFCAFMIRQIKIPDSPNLADRQFRDARQHRDESLRDFTTYLALLETGMVRSLTDEDRIAKFWHGMLDELRVEAANDPSIRRSSYGKQIDLLARLESRSPSRVYLLCRHPKSRDRSMGDRVQ